VDRLKQPWDLDVQRLYRGRLYQEIMTLMERSRSYQRAIRLLSARKERHDGETDRLWALSNAYWLAGMSKQAATTMDQYLAFNASDSATLELCIKVYKAVKDVERVKACRRLLSKANATPAGRPLWEWRRTKRRRAKQR